MEYWSAGVLAKGWLSFDSNPILHYSRTPRLQNLETSGKLKILLYQL
jgi:hypothetical protein